MRRKRDVYDCRIEQQHSAVALSLQSALPIAARYMLSVLMDGEQTTAARLRAADSLAKLSSESFEREVIARRLRARGPAQ